MTEINNISAAPDGLRVVFILRRTGPYHHSRFSALAKLVSLITIETRPSSNEYPWKFEAAAIYKTVKFNVTEDAESGLKGQILRTELARVFDRYLPDVVITTGWSDHEYHAAVLESRRRKIPCVVISDSRYEDEPRVFYKEWIKRTILKSYSSAIVAGKMSTRYLIRLGFKSEQIFQPWDVVDNFHFAAGSLDYQFSERAFLCVSRFIPKKNLCRLIDAFQGYRLSGGSRHLIILGDGMGESDLRERIAQYQLQDFIHLRGFVQYDELPVQFKSALCLILPSTSDQWGLVVNEAMAAGLPVLVSTQCGCVEDLVQPGNNGITFDPFKTDQLTAAMQSIDRKTENQWHGMCEASKDIIRSWNVEVFAEAAEKASRYAVRNPAFGTFGGIHLLLSR